MLSDRFHAFEWMFFFFLWFFDWVTSCYLWALANRRHISSRALATLPVLTINTSTPFSTTEAQQLDYDCQRRDLSSASTNKQSVTQTQTEQLNNVNNCDFLLLLSRDSRAESSSFCLSARGLHTKCADDSICAITFSHFGCGGYMSAQCFRQLRSES